MNIALVQFYPYHEEVMSPQIDFLCREHKLYIAAPQSVINNDYISCYKAHFKPIIFKKYSSFLFSRIFSVFGKYKQLSKIHKIIKFDIIIFNTITRKFHIKIIKHLFKNVKLIHLIHNGQYYKSKKEILKYLNVFYNNIFISFDIYNKYLENTYKTFAYTSLKKPSLNWFCPLLPARIIENYKSEKIIFDKSLINIIIPGSIEQKRRNYYSLFSALEKYKTKPNLKFKIYLLGKINIEMLDNIKTSGIQNMIEYFTEYVSGEDMLYAVKNADAMAFLIDSQLGDSFFNYNNFKVSGTTSLCLTFCTPCIVSDDYKLEGALREKALYYTKDNIEEVFDKIEDGLLKKVDFEKLRLLPLDEIYSYSYQKKHYISLIGAN